MYYVVKNYGGGGKTPQNLQKIYKMKNGFFAVHCNFIFYNQRSFRSFLMTKRESRWLSFLNCFCSAQPASVWSALRCCTQHIPSTNRLLLRLYCCIRQKIFRKMHAFYFIYRKNILFCILSQYAKLYIDCVLFLGEKMLRQTS